MKIKIPMAFASIILILLFCVLWNLLSGSTSIGISQVLEVIAGKSQDSRIYRVIWSIRLPRLLTALVLGGALSVSGFLLQTFFANPIAGPYVLGISSGAKLFVALVMIFFTSKGIYISSVGNMAAAFLGSMAAMGLVLLLSLKVNSMSVLIICGILIGYICSAVTDFLVTFADDSNIVNLHNWAVGSFSGSNWNDVKIICIMVFSSLAVSIFLSKSIGAFRLGENYARNMGVNVKFLRIMLILLSSLLSACVTAFAGPVSFVGIAVPHLVKTVTGTSRPLILIPACFLGGSAITVFCDGLARSLFAPAEVSISSVTAALLVPVVIYMMIKNQRRK